MVKIEENQVFLSFLIEQISIRGYISNNKSKIFLVTDNCFNKIFYYNSNMLNTNCKQYFIIENPGLT